MTDRVRHDAVRARARRGTAMVALLLVLVIVSLAVIGLVISGGREHELAARTVQGSRAAYAADAAAHMAVKELMDKADRDGDGTIGSISNDANTSTDPTLSGMRLWAGASTAGDTTTVNARAQGTAEVRATRVVLKASVSASSRPTVLLVVHNAAALDAQESVRRSLIEGWGYIVSPISANSSQASFDAALRVSSMVYISETVASGDVGTKLNNTPLGVITEESAISDELGFSASMTTLTGAAVSITNNTHYITSGFSLGSLTIFSSDQLLRYLSGTLGGFTTLGQQPGTSNPTFAVMERGATLTPSGTAAGRRVYLPWGNTSMNINMLNADGRLLMRRSIEWCLLPVAYYALDSAAGPTAVDSIAAHNGTLHGSVWTAGKLNNGLRFDGVDDYVSIPNHSVFQITNAITVTGWINAAAWPAPASWASVILRKGEAAPVNWEFSIMNGRATLALNTTDELGVKGNTVMSLNAWHHVAGTWDGAHVRIYVDGVLDNTPSAHTAVLGTDTRSVYLGGRTGASEDVSNGVVDDIRLYSRALTAGEIAQLAANGPPSLKITSWSQVSP